jgi:hypothetical protein
VTDYVWRDVLERAVRLFGDVPHAATEQAVLEAFERSPALVAAAVEHVGQQVAAGSVRSGWAVLRARLERSSAAGEVVADDELERGQRVTLAERWVRTAGVHFDRESEVDDALFGEHGRLRAWAGDELLRARLLELWHADRPRGEQVERDELERAARWREVRKRLESERRRGTGTDPDDRAGEKGEQQ